MARHRVTSKGRLIRSEWENGKLGRFHQYTRFQSRAWFPRVCFFALTGVLVFTTLPFVSAAMCLSFVVLAGAVDMMLLRVAATHGRDHAKLFRFYLICLASAAVVSLVTASVSIMVWIQSGGTHSRMLVSAFLFGGALNASLQLPLYKGVAIFRIALYSAVIAGLYGSAFLLQSYDKQALGYEILGIGFLLFWGFLYCLFYVQIDAANRKMRHALIEQQARTEAAYRDLENKQVELRRLSLVARFARDSVIVSNPDGTILWVNDAFTRISGYTRAEAIGHRPADFLNSPNTDLAVSKAISSHLEQGEPFRTQILNKRRDGTEIWVDVQTVPVLDTQGNVELVIAVERDVTEDRARERDLAEAKLAAEQGERAKSDFLATMSHEIRTPMNGILGMSEVLAETGLNEDQQVYVDTIRGSADALLKIINDILDMSKLDAGQMTIDPRAFSLRNCLADAVGLMRPQAAQKGLTLDLAFAPGLPDRLVGDDGRIRQILLNLLGNATKFTESGGIRVEVDVVETDIDPADGSNPGAPGETMDIRISIQDTGIGINEDRLDSIFAEFAQADSATTRRYGGTGLGLSISRMLARAMNGDIDVTSEEGKGSRFDLTLRLGWEASDDTAAVESADMPAKAPPRTPANWTRQIKLLVAEDNRTNRLLVEKFLSPTASDLLFAKNGKEAVKLVQRERPEIVLMDMSMPEMDGLTATRRIRTGPGPQPVIIALTANAFDSDRDACFEAGMNDFLSKPIRKDDLIAMIARHVRDAAA